MTWQVLEVTGSSSGAWQVLEVSGSVSPTDGSWQVLNIAGTVTAGGGTWQVLDITGTVDNALPTGAGYRATPSGLVQVALFINTADGLVPLDTIRAEPGEPVTPPAKTGLGLAPLGVSPLGG